MTPIVPPALLDRARAMDPGADPEFALAVRSDGVIRADGPEPADDPDDALVTGAVTDILAAAHAVHGRRWAARGDQDLWHEGGDSEAAASDPVRLDSIVTRTLKRLRREAGRSDPADLSSARTTPRARLARAAVESMGQWSAAHFHHLFGATVHVPDLLAALDRPHVTPPVNYFRRTQPCAGAFAAGSLVLAGDTLPLDPRRLYAPPAESDGTRTLYVRTTRRYEVPPTDGERAEAHR